MSSPAQILLVEDSDDDAFFFRWTLQKSGLDADLQHLADGGRAIEQLQAVLEGRARRPDIVFLDLKLPTYSGFEILQWIGRQAWPDPLCVIVLSGSEHASDVARAQSLGATGYLVKPISVQQLRERLPAATLKTAPTAK